MNNEEVTMPWYRVPEFWLMVGIPGATVIGCIFTIYLAITHPDPVLKAPPTSVEQIRP